MDRNLVGTRHRYGIDYTTSPALELKMKNDADQDHYMRNWDDTFMCMNLQPQVRYIVQRACNRANEFLRERDRKFNDLWIGYKRLGWI